MTPVSLARPTMTWPKNCTIESPMMCSRSGSAEVGNHGIVVAGAPVATSPSELPAPAIAGVAGSATTTPARAGSSATAAPTSSTASSAATEPKGSVIVPGSDTSRPNASSAHRRGRCAPAALAAPSTGSHTATETSRSQPNGFCWASRSSCCELSTIASANPSAPASSTLPAGAPMRRSVASSGGCGICIVQNWK